MSRYHAVWRMAAHVNGLQPPSNFVASAQVTLLQQLLLPAMNPNNSVFSAPMNLAVGL